MKGGVMERELLKSRVLSVVKKYRQKDFVGEMIDDVLLTNIFGENQWHTLGAIVIEAELKEEFDIDIPEDGLSGCETIGDLISFVASAIKEMVFGQLNQRPAQGVLEGISGGLLARQFSDLP
jgi:acyl carrier protein